MINASQKLDILRCIFSNKPLHYVLEGLDAAELSEVQMFVWEKAIEFGVLDKGASFSKMDIARNIRPLRSKDGAPVNPLLVTRHSIETICRAAKEFI